MLSSPGQGALEPVGTVAGTGKHNAFCYFDHIGILSHVIHFAHIQTAGLASSPLISGNTANTYISAKEITFLTASGGLVNTNKSKVQFASS